MDYRAWIAALAAALLGSGGMAAWLRIRPENRALDSSTLAKVAEATQEVYEKLTRDLRLEVDRVVARERECRDELAAVHRRLDKLESKGP